MGKFDERVFNDFETKSREFQSIHKDAIILFTADFESGRDGPANLAAMKCCAFSSETGVCVKPSDGQQIPSEFSFLLNAPNQNYVLRRTGPVVCLGDSKRTKLSFQLLGHFDSFSHDLNFNFVDRTLSTKWRIDYGHQTSFYTEHNQYNKISLRRQLLLIANAKVIFF